MKEDLYKKCKLYDMNNWGSNWSLRTECEVDPKHLSVKEVANYRCIAEIASSDVEFAIVQAKDRNIAINFKI